MVRAAQRDLEGGSRVEVQESRDRGELVERKDSVTFILMVPGYSNEDFRVGVARGVLRIDAPDFELTRAVGRTVDSVGVKTEYRNGVLSVRIPKKF